MSMEYCPHCGAKVYLSDQFCSSCGHRLISKAQRDGTCEPLLSEYAKRSGLFRSTDEGAVGGVCAGIACKWKLNLYVVRAIAVAAALLSAGFVLALYLILWVVLPGLPTLHYHSSGTI